MAVTRSLMMGILAAASALIIEAALSFAFSDSFSVEHLSAYGNIPALFTLALIEEALILFMVIKIRQENIHLNSIFLLSIVCGVGFTFFELALRLLQQDILELISPAYVGILLIHIFTAGLFGLFLSRKEPRPVRLVALYAVASIIHFAYNYLVIILG